MHVFVQAGLQPVFERFSADPVRVLEIGFGTGLNALLSAREAGASRRAVVYTGIEKFPLTAEESSQLNYGRLSGLEELFAKINTAEWENETAVSPWFRLRKLHLSLPATFETEPVHGIYLDPFAPDTNPGLWTQAFFEELYSILLPQGILVTYCSKSVIRHALTAAGFTVTKIPGPWGKREMVRAEK
jgi:tRNA U34 5-methylaminomethyl-2-thiouridine-forming methyltransferase MnmC